MSRTIRRKGDKKRNKSGSSSSIHWYITDWSIDKDGNYQGRVPLEGKEYDQGYWKFHRDHHNSYGWSNHTWDRWHYEQRCRMKNKEEIIRYLNDENYEVFAHQPGCLSWER
jgi:hypothetical protein